MTETFFLQESDSDQDVGTSQSTSGNPNATNSFLSSSFHTSG